MKGLETESRILLRVNAEKDGVHCNILGHRILCKRLIYGVV